LGTEDCIRQIHPENVLKAVQQLLNPDRRKSGSPIDLFQPEFARV